MVHVNHIEDATGELVDLEYFCSDLCATESEHYNKWNGCNELHFAEVCQSCQSPLGYWSESGAYIQPQTQSIIAQCYRNDWLQFQLN